ncbi:MBL fold metallo-hydrolase [Salinicoccus hispanicus]|uniref:MBL fold metallo-hydrolase n=1 Tax=Salinicoccus hispanicus TaxID=157225 RepID=A0A6N8U3N8_9STAP|nr:MBL fold metallo-hydrolase [Salinicoccus hispanicus]MXQ51055.1 MBL fold metallo-hydrolase [Salinicoccus hispanicus]
MKCTVIGMWGGFPKKSEPTSGYLVQKDGFSILLDAGSGVAAHVQNHIDLNDLHHVFLSHYHYDHSVDIGAFLFGRMISTQLGRVDKVLNFYGPSDKGVEKQVNKVKNNRFHPYGKDSTFKVGPFSIVFHKNAHTVETYAMRITDDNGRVLVYTADTSYRKSLIRFTEDADVLISECSLYAGTDGEKMGHMNAEEVGNLAAKAGVKRLILSHLPHYGDLDELAASAKAAGGENVTLAEAGMEIEV